MIVKRKYATYGQLLNDSPSRKAITSAFLSHGISEEDAMAHMERLWFLHIFNTEMGSGIPGIVFRTFCDEFENLDKTCPYDNQLTYQDVNRTICFPSRKGNTMTQVLYHAGSPDDANLIVQVIAFENDGVNIKPIQPWDFGRIQNF